MSIVPRDVVDDWAGDWADTVVRGGPDLHEYIADRAAQWALEHAAKACENKGHKADGAYDMTDACYGEGFADAAYELAGYIRAMISPEGKIKGGESDEREGNDNAG
jgi:hypothetical protein